MLRNKTKINDNYKKLPRKKLFAFTLAEILLVFSFIGIIAVTYSIDSRAKIDTTQKKLLLYNAFKSLDLASTEIARNNKKVVPDDGVTFCQALADIFNTVGDINCDSNLASFGADFRTPNFVTSNGMSFYNVSAASIADISDANKLITSSDITTINTKATNKAKSEIDSVMNAIGDAAASEARANFHQINYTVTAKYTKYEEKTGTHSDDNGTYEIYAYNYNVTYENDGKPLPQSNKAYASDATCYNVIQSNQTLEQLLGSATRCSSVKTEYEKTFSASGSIKTTIEERYEADKNEAANNASSEAKSASREAKELDKLYQKYYNQYFQELYTQKAASLPKVHNVYVDINGSRGNSKLNEDVFLFLVRSDGKTVPAKNSDLANSTNIISAGYYTRNHSPISTSLTFRQAACKTKRFEDIDYDATYGYCAGISIDTNNCPRKNACYYKINQPKSMWSLF